MSSNNAQGTLYGTVIALINVLKSSNELVPGVVAVAGSIGAITIWVCAHFGGLMVGSIAITVFVVSTVVYASKGSFGDAALGLAVGIFAAFAVSWDGGRFAIFESLWLAFGLYVLLFVSVKHAADEEAIYRHAAQAIGAEDSEGIERQLRAIARDCDLPILGPIERAETLRLFAYRRVPIEAMGANLTSVGIISAISRIEHQTVASYVVDVWRMFESRHSMGEEALRDKAFLAMRDSGVSLLEFLEAFHQSRRLVLDEGIDVELYLGSLTQATANGVPASEMYEHLKTALPVKQRSA